MPKTRPYSMDLAGQVRLYLDSQEWVYKFDEQSGIFSFGIFTKTAIPAVSVRVRLLADGVLVITKSPHNCICGRFDRLAELMCRINYTLLSGCFQLDFNDGEISFRNVLVCNDELPDLASLEYAVDLGFIMMSRFGEAIMRTVFTDQPPAEILSDYQ